MSDSKLFGVNELSYYKDRVQALIDRDRPLQEMRTRMDDMVHADYQAPQSLQDLQWFRTYRSSKPRDALKAAIRALSNFEEHVVIDPATVVNALGGIGDPDGKIANEMAGSWERTLKWQMRQAQDRRMTFKPDATRSAVLYDECVGLIIHLPTQIAGKKRLGASTIRNEQALQNGDWAIVNRLPSTVYIEESDYMVESASSVMVRTAQEIVWSWGEAAKDMQEAIESGSIAPNDPYVEIDSTDRGSRAVWCVKGDDPTKTDGEEYVIWAPSELDYPVFPWVAVIGGTNLDEGEHRRDPLLMSVYLTEQWLATNIVGSLLVSEAIAEFGRPKTEKQGPGAKDIRTRYGVPGGEWVTGPLQKIIDHPRQAGDPALRELFQQFNTTMDEASLARILVTSESAPGEPFAGFNLRIQTALGTLIPYKKTVERYYAGIYRNMLLQAHYSGNKILGYGKGKSDYGVTYVIEPEWIDPKRIYLDVSQEADVPIDRTQKINGAVMLSREIKGLPADYILEELGVDDPQRAIRQWKKEQYSLAYAAGRVQAGHMETSGEIQKIVQEQIQAMMQQQQAQQAQQPPQQGPRPTPPEPGGGMGVPGQEALGGIGNNPALGGEAAATSNPEGATFEGATGMTRGGQEIQGGGF